MRFSGRPESVLLLAGCRLGQKFPLFRRSGENSPGVGQLLLLSQETVLDRKLPIFF